MRCTTVDRAWAYVPGSQPDKNTPEITLHKRRKYLSSNHEATSITWSIVSFGFLKILTHWIMERFPRSVQEAEQLIQLADLLKEAAKTVIGEWKKEEFPKTESANSFYTQDTAAVLPNVTLHEAQRVILAATGAITELVVEPYSRVQEVACQYFESRALFIAAERRIPDLLEEAGLNGMDIATLSAKTEIEKGKLCKGS
jgi:hypothetical protein